MNNSKHCESCGMTIDDGTYCQYCVDENGDLQTFEERVERMTQWMQNREGIESRQDAEQQVLQYMSTMPAWRNHPSLKQRLK